MPTGYTRGVGTGEYTIAKFVRHCALAFVGDYDELPIELRKNTHYETKSKELAAEARKLKRLSGDRLRAAFSEYVSSRRAQRDVYAAERKTVAKRYKDMIARVDAVAWPAELHELKAFMMAQLEDSLAHDCSPIAGIQAAGKRSFVEV